MYPPARFFFLLLYIEGEEGMSINTNAKLGLVAVERSVMTAGVWSEIRDYVIYPLSVLHLLCSLFPSEVRNVLLSVALYMAFKWSGMWLRGGEEDDVLHLIFFPCIECTYMA